MIPLSLALAGCHVFETIDIPCASDEPCARPPKDGADADTDADTDTDTDTDTSTPPVVEPSRGWAISGTTTHGNRVLVYGPTGQLVQSWTDLGDYAGAIAYDAATTEGVLASDDSLIHLLANGGYSVSDPDFPYVADVAFVDDTAYVATGDNLLGWSASTEGAVTAFDANLAGLVAVAPGPDGSVYASDTDNGFPDLYQWTLGDTPVRLFTDFDRSAARARVLFPGPRDLPYSCSSAGAIYNVADLADDNSAPVVFYAGGLTDVSACAYDPGDETWLLFSPTGGVVRMDAQGRGEVVMGPDDGFTFVRASFY